MGSRRALSILRAAPFLIALLAAPSARADATASERAMARRKMDDGYERRARGDLAGALADFVAADAIMHVSTAGLDVARTLADLGRLIEARARAVEVTHLPAIAREPLALRTARAQAASLVSNLELRIPRLRISVDGDDSLPQRWTLDGRELSSAALAGPILVDPGGHELRLDRGTEHFAFDIRVAEGEQRDVRAPPPEVAPPVAARTAAAPLPLPPVQLPAAGEHKTSTLPGRVMWGSFLTAGAAVAVGTVTGALALNAAADGREGCVGGRCPPSTWGALDRARTLADVSTVSLLVGGLAFATGLVALWLRAPSPRRPSDVAALSW